MSEERITNPSPMDDEQLFDQSLRPGGFGEFVGQEKITSNLKVFIRAALERGEALDHVLFYGPTSSNRRILNAFLSKLSKYSVNPYLNGLISVCYGTF